jgi:hypothetical protein
MAASDEQKAKGHRVAGGRLIYIDPNDLPAQGYNVNPDSSSDNVPWKQEDLMYSVDLMVAIPNMSDCGQIDYNQTFVTNINNNGTTSLGKYVSFMMGDLEKDNVNYQSTDFIDASYQALSEGKLSKENLGITSVDVDFDAHFFPQVTINFVDVRGYSLFMPEENDYKKDLQNEYLASQGQTDKISTEGYQNFFKALFHFPYPRFLLSIKGYYGSRVTFTLSVSDFRTSFNSTTGNFEVTVKFIGYMYGIYTDIPMLALIVAPYVKLSNDNSETETNRTWNNNSRAGGNYAFDANTPMITFIEYLKKYSEVAENIDTNILRGDKATQILFKNNAKKNALNALKGYYNDVLSMIGVGNDNTFQRINGGQYVGFFTAGPTIGLPSDKIKAFITKFNGIKEDYSDLNLPDVMSENKLSADTVNKTPQEIFTNGKIDDEKWEKLKIGANGTEFRKAIQTVLDEQNGKDDSKITGEPLKNKKVYVFNKKGFEECIETTISSLETEIEELTNSEESFNTVKQAVSAALGFVPTVDNVYRMIFAHLDCFITIYYQILNKINTKLQLKGNSPRCCKKLGLTKDNVEARISDDTPLYPFPGILQVKNNARTLVYPAEMPNITSDNFPELELIEAFIKAITVSGKKTASVQEYLAQLNAKKENGETDDFSNNLDNSLSLFLPDTIDNNTNSWATLNPNSESTFYAGTVMDIFYHGHNPYEYFQDVTNGALIQDCGDALLHFFMTRYLLYRCIHGGNQIKYEDNKKTVTTDNKRIDAFVTNETNLFLSKFGEEYSNCLNEGIQNFKGDDDKYSDLKKRISTSGFISLNDMELNPLKCFGTLNNQELGDYICDETKLSDETHNQNTFRICVDDNTNKFYINSLGGNHFKYTYISYSTGNVKANTNEHNPVQSNVCKYFDKGNEQDYGRLYLFENVDSKEYTGITISGTDNLHESDITSYAGIVELAKNGDKRVCLPYLHPVMKDVPRDANAFISDSLTETTGVSFMEALTKHTEDAENGDIKYTATELTMFGRMLLTYALMCQSMQYIGSMAYETTIVAQMPYVYERYLYYSVIRYIVYQQVGVDILKLDKIKEGHIKKKNFLKEHKKCDYLIINKKGIMFGNPYQSTLVSIIQNILYPNINSKLKIESVTSRENNYFNELYNRMSDPRNMEQKVFSGETIMTWNRDIQEDLIKIMGKTVILVVPRKVQTYAFNETDATYALTTFEKKLKEAFKTKTQSTDRNEEEAKEAQVTVEETLTQKRSLYYTFKSLYERWFASMTAEPFKLDSHELTRENQKKRYEHRIGTVDKSNKVNREYSNFLFVDSFQNWIGDKFLINPQVLFDILMSHTADSTSSVYEFMAEIAQKNKLLFLALPIYSNFYDENNIADIFMPHNQYEPNNALDMGIGNTYVCMYTHEASKYLDDASKNGIGNDGFDISDSLGIVEVEKEATSMRDIDTFNTGNNKTDGLNLSVPAFNVAYGKQNQNYFKTITVNMDNPAVTDYSISNLLQIAQGGSHGASVAPIGTGQNIYSIYSNRSYSCTVTMMGCMNIMPMMYFQLNNLPMFKGAYMIVSVKHNIVPGNMTTTFTGIRVSKRQIPYNQDVFNVQAIIENVASRLGNAANGVGIYTYIPPGHKSAPTGRKGEILASLISPAPASKEEAAKYMEKVTVQVHGEKQVIKSMTFSVHKALVEDVKSIFNEIFNLTVSGTTKYFEVVSVSAFRYTYVDGTDTLSTHAYGCALDINGKSDGWDTNTNPYLEDSTEWLRSKLNPLRTIPNEKHPVVKIFESYGWTWGGRFKKHDYMHFSYAKA